MRIRTLLVSIGLLIAGGFAMSQPLPKPTSGGVPPAPPKSSSSPPDLARPYRDWTPTPPVNAPEKPVEELLTELERVQAQKAELERKEKELKAAIGKKLEEQTERLKKLGISSDNAEGASTRDEKILAPYPLTFDKDSPKKDKEEVVVLILPQLAPGTKAEFVTTDRDLASKLAKALPDQLKENKDKKKMRVISLAQVDKFKMANPQWKQMSAGEIGKKLGADFVLEIYMDRMRLYQPGSLNQIYEGRAELSVTVHEVGAEESGFKGKYADPTQYPTSFAYPETGVRNASSMPESEFKKQFLENLTTLIVRHHVDYKSAEPDRVGRIIIEGNIKTPDRKILDKLKLQPGQILEYPKLEDARRRLQKAGFREVMIEVILNNLNDTFKDIRIKVVEKDAR